MTPITFNDLVDKLEDAFAICYDHNELIYPSIDYEDNETTIVLQSDSFIETLIESDIKSITFDGDTGTYIVITHTDETTLIQLLAIIK